MNPEGGWPIAALRALSDASLLSMLGALVFRAAIAPAGLAIARWSAAAALLALPAWVVAQAVNLGGSVAATPEILTITEFGHLAAASWMCALLVLLVAGRGIRLGLALVAAIAAVVLQTGHSHAAAMDPGPSLLRISTTIHLLAAGAWLGGLLPLAWMVAHGALPGVVTAVRRYSVVGIVCVLLLAGTATIQASVLVGSLAGWFGTQYGAVAIAKALLFTMLIALALANRQSFGPALAGAQPERARRRLAASISVEIVVGLAVVSAAALLSSLEPAMHQQPVWPFSVLPSLVTVDEDPEFLREVVLASAALGGAALLLVAAFALRRLRIAAAAGAAVIAWFALPHLDLLFIPATPTSFFHSPTAFAATSIVRGATLFPANCASCHGANGQGDGPLAATLPEPPADLTAAHLWMHGDGELFWWLSHGIEAPDGGMAMPGFANLSDDDRWALIDDIRAHNAGLTRRRTGVWSPPLQAPELNAACPDGRTLTLADLRGKAVRLVFPGQAPPPPLPDADAVTIVAGPSAAECSADDPAVPKAYAIVLGVPPASLPGTTVLIDPNGWLRSDDADRLDAVQLAAAVRQICSHPLAAMSGNHHHAE